MRAAGAYRGAMNTATRLLLTALLCALLSACGGNGDDAEEEEVPNRGPVDCKARPDLCI